MLRVPRQLMVVGVALVGLACGFIVSEKITPNLSAAQPASTGKPAAETGQAVGRTVGILLVIGLGAGLFYQRHRLMELHAALQPRRETPNPPRIPRVSSTAQELQAVMPSEVVRTRAVSSQVAPVQTAQPEALNDIHQNDVYQEVSEHIPEVPLIEVSRVELGRESEIPLAASQPALTAASHLETTRLARANIIQDFIEDLQHSDPAIRRRAIWELAQKGDAQALHPLVESLMDADSQQRSLILAALSEIGTRTFRPLNRALLVSLQDENAEVRKNAIRDITRIYEQMTQIGHLLAHAIHDPDPEVQETARWAMNQLNRLRPMPPESPLPSTESTEGPGTP